MAVDLVFNDEAKDALINGATKVKDAVAATLGPRGQNVAIMRDWGVPRVVHDGVTVAKAITLKDDDPEKAGADLMKDAAERTNNDAGDGTTLTTILAHAILKEGLRNIAAGSNAMMIRRGIEAGVQVICDQLYQQAIPVKTKDQKRQIATISAQSESIGSLIVEALEQVGDEGVVTVEQGNTADIEIEYKEGMQFDKGWISPHFVSNRETMEADVEKPVILVTNKTVGNMQELLPLIQLVVDEHKINQFVVIAKSVVGEPLATLALNNMKGNIRSIAIEAPGTGEQQDNLLTDIATLTGATFVHESLNRGFNELTMDDLGRADRVVSSQERTIIVGGKGDEKTLKDHVKFIREQLKRTDISEYQTERLQERLAKLVAGVAVIQVGANSDAEADEKRERIIDAVAATRAAVDEGIVAGGEMALLTARNKLDDIVTTDREQEIGIRIVQDAVKYPFDKLMENAGLDPGEQWARVQKEPAGHGVDVIDQQVKDLVKAGIIDPVKVVRTALQNAASTATMIMTTGAIIVPIKEQDNAAQQLPR